MMLLPPSLSRYVYTALVASLIAVHAWLAVTATVDLGVTGDETVHLTGGYSYWRFNDYRLHPENGNLPQRWAALPLLLLKPDLDPRVRPDLWNGSDAWQIGQQFFFESGNNIDYLLLWARSAMVLWSVAMGLLVFFWSKQICGERGALLSLTLFVFSPTILAHGALVTSDMCATFCLLAATGAWWRLTEYFTMRRMVLSLGAVGLAAVSKFSFVLLLPIFALIAGWRLIIPDVSTTGDNPRPSDQLRRTSWGKTVTFLGFGIVHAAFAAAIIWICFGLRFSAFSAGLPAAAGFFAPTEPILPPAGVLRSLLDYAFEHKILPQGFLHGFAYVLFAARERASFLAGEYSSTGWWWFFPFAFLVKSSLAELLTVSALAVMGPLTWLRSKKDFLRKIEPMLPLLIFALVYGTFSLTSHLNIGQRHIMPLYPIVFILSGLLIGEVRRIAPESQIKPERGGSNRESWKNSSLSGRPWFAFGIATLLVVESTSIRPHYLAFFNYAVGGPDAGRRLLGDSSLDWGQNLPRLADWVRSNRFSGEAVYVSNFGADDPLYEGLDATELAPYYSFQRPLKWAPLTAGLYCVGASMLQDASSPFRGAWTRNREAYYQRLKATVEADLAANRRSPIFGVGVSNDTELLTLDRARFARLCVYLRARSPDTVVGHSILVYRLTALEVRLATEGSLEELIDATTLAATVRLDHGS